jgi:tRNA pseudouridine32 synthase/23S rRNA pseudouridine746 synthase
MRISKTIVVSEHALAIDVLCAAVPELSKARLKDAMNKGAVSWQRGKQHKRLRRAQSPVASGEQLHLNYDSDLLQRSCDNPVLLADEGSFSVWFKPAGMLSQGNEWGDHLSLLRFAELYHQSKRPVFLLHRLDREASGLMLIAHQQKTAAELSQLIQQQQISKKYQVLVLGKLDAELVSAGQINAVLDGKACETRFSLVPGWQQTATTLLDITLISGRKHQIRRHFADIGHPVMGDPRYGTHNQDPAGLGLQAVELSFALAAGRRKYHYLLPAELRRYPGK